jgi:hypothetical protein
VRRRLVADAVGLQRPIGDGGELPVAVEAAKVLDAVIIER